MSQAGHPDQTPIEHLNNHGETGGGVVSKPGRNLALAILGGLAFGLLTSAVNVGTRPLTDLFLQNNSRVYEGWYWQLFTSLVVAPADLLGAIDVLFNAAAVVYLDGLLSGAFDSIEYYVVFIFSGLSGNLISLLNGPLEVSFGASGGIFGLLAGVVSQDFAAERRINYGLMVWFLLVFIFSSFALSYVDWLAHLGGAIFGLLAGYLLGARRRSRLP